MKYSRVFTSVFIVSTLLFGWTHFVLAEGTTSDDINTLNQEIELKQHSIDQLNRQIEEYRKKIEQKQSQTNSLINEIDIIENRIAKTKLDIESGMVNEKIERITQVAIDQCQDIGGETSPTAIIEVSTYNFQKFLSEQVVKKRDETKEVYKRKWLSSFRPL